MVKTKSGSSWVKWANTNAKNSTKLSDLNAGFKTNVDAFIAALKAGGATVTINTTKRSDKRAYLFHWSWKISQGKVKAKDATAMADVDIEWDHGTEKASKAGAKEMVTGFGLAVPPKSTVAPSLTSNHISGKAVDMVITWKGEMSIKDKTGKTKKITYMSNVNSNTALHNVGATYGVKKLTSDAPHWSHNGR